MCRLAGFLSLLSCEVAAVASTVVVVVVMLMMVAAVIVIVVAMVVGAVQSVETLGEETQR